MRATSMMKALQTEGFKAQVLFLYKKRPAYDNISGVSVLLDRPPINVADFVTILVRLYHHIKQFKPTAVVGMAHYSSPIATLVAMLLGVPRRVATQTNPPKTHNILARILDWICGTTGVYTANIAASVAIYSDFVKYPSTYRKRLKVVTNGITIRNPTLTRAEAREKFGLSPKRYLLVNCGRLSEQKNQKYLFQVIENLPDVDLVIIGEGEKRAALEKEILDRGLSSRVTLLGEVAPDIVPNVLICGDVFLFPSTYEAFGLAAVEAMRSGLPVIASNHPALVEVIGNAGILLPLTHPKKWADEVMHIRQDNAFLEEIKMLGFQRSEEFSFEAMLAGFKKHIF